MLKTTPMPMGLFIRLFSGAIKKSLNVYILSAVPLKAAPMPSSFSVFILKPVPPIVPIMPCLNIIGSHQKIKDKDKPRAPAVIWLSSIFLSNMILAAAYNMKKSPKYVEWVGEDVNAVTMLKPATMLHLLSYFIRSIA